MLGYYIKDIIDHDGIPCTRLNGLCKAKASDRICELICVKILLQGCLIRLDREVVRLTKQLDAKHIHRCFVAPCSHLCSHEFLELVCYLYLVRSQFAYYVLYVCVCKNNRERHVCLFLYIRHYLCLERYRSNYDACSHHMSVCLIPLRQAIQRHHLCRSKCYCAIGKNERLLIIRASPIRQLT